MKSAFLKVQSVVTKVFIWTSPLGLVLLLATNFPNLEKIIWSEKLASLIFSLTFIAWLLSLIFVIISTFVSAQFKDKILHDLVLRKDQDERESFLSGYSAKKSILITLGASILILFCTTGRYNKAETTEKSSITIGHFQLSDNVTTTTTQDGSTIIHYQLPMSKMSIVLILILIQLSSYHTIKFLNIRKSEL